MGKYVSIQVSIIFLISKKKERENIQLKAEAYFIYIFTGKHYRWTTRAFDKRCSCFSYWVVICYSSKAGVRSIWINLSCFISSKRIQLFFLQCAYFLISLPMIAPSFMLNNSHDHHFAYLYISTCIEIVRMQFLIAQG